MLLSILLDGYRHSGVVQKNFRKMTIGVPLAVFIPTIIFLIALILSKKDMKKIMAAFERQDKKLDKLDDISDTLKEMRDILNEINRKLK